MAMAMKMGGGRGGDDNQTDDGEQGRNRPRTSI